MKGVTKAAWAVALVGMIGGAGAAAATQGSVLVVSAPHGSGPAMKVVAAGAAAAGGAAVASAPASAVVGGAKVAPSPAAGSGAEEKSAQADGGKAATLDAQAAPTPEPTSARAAVAAKEPAASKPEPPSAPVAAKEPANSKPEPPSAPVTAKEPAASNPEHLSASVAAPQAEHQPTTSGATNTAEAKPALAPPTTAQAGADAAAAPSKSVDQTMTRELEADAPSTPVTTAVQAVKAAAESALAASLPTAMAATPAPTPPTTPSDSPSTIRLLVILAWEGRDLQPYNLDALRAFRAKFPDVAVTHLLSAAYFLRPTEDAAKAAQDVRTLVRPHDQLAVLLGGWKSVAAKAGVIFRRTPTFWGHTLRAEDCQADCGLEVPVHVYPESEVEKLLQTSLATLDQQGFGRPKGLAVEGWVASPAVLEAAARVGLRYDLSPVSPEMVSRRVHLYPLYGWLKALWPTVTPHTQPHAAPVGLGLTEVPQSLAALDYTSGDDVMNVFKEYVDRERHEGAKDLVFPLVVYQETAKMTLPLLSSSLQAMFAYAAAHDVALAPAVFPGLEAPETAAPPPHAPAPVAEQPLVH